MPEGETPGRSDKPDLAIRRVLSQAVPARWSKGILKVGFGSIVISVLSWLITKLPEDWKVFIGKPSNTLILTCGLVASIVTILLFISFKLWLHHREIMLEKEQSHEAAILQKRFEFAKEDRIAERLHQLHRLEAALKAIDDLQNPQREVSPEMMRLVGTLLGNSSIEDYERLRFEVLSAKEELENMLDSHQQPRALESSPLDEVDEPPSSGNDSEAG